MEAGNTQTRDVEQKLVAARPDVRELNHRADRLERVLEAISAQLAALEQL